MAGSQPPRGLRAAIDLTATQGFAFGKMSLPDATFRRTLASFGSLLTENKVEYFEGRQCILFGPLKRGIEYFGTGVRNNLTVPDPALREADVEMIKSWIECAAQLGAPVLRVFAGKGIPEGSTEDKGIDNPSASGSPDGRAGLAAPGIEQGVHSPGLAAMII